MLAIIVWSIDRAITSVVHIVRSPNLYIWCVLSAACTYTPIRANPRDKYVTTAGINRTTLAEHRLYANEREELRSRKCRLTRPPIYLKLPFKERNGQWEPWIILTCISGNIACVCTQSRRLSLGAELVFSLEVHSTVLRPNCLELVSDNVLHIL